MTYEYTNITTAPDLNQIEIDIENSSMTDKAHDGGRWDEDTAILQMFFDNELSAGDKTILDGIISDNT